MLSCLSGEGSIGSYVYNPVAINVPEVRVKAGILPSVHRSTTSDIPNEKDDKLATSTKPCIPTKQSTVLTEVQERRRKCRLSKFANGWCIVSQTVFLEHIGTQAFLMPTIQEE